MGLRDFFSNIIDKITGRNKQMLMLPGALPYDDVKKEEEVIPEVENNAYVNAYTRQMNRQKSDFKIGEDGTRIRFLDTKTGKTIEVQRMKIIKENFGYNDVGYDLYKAIYAIGGKEDRKLKKVYFALPTGKGILDLYKGSTRKASLKTKLKTLFSSSVIENKKCFLGLVVEDEIYNDYRLVKSNKLEEYVIELEKKKQMIKKNKEKSKEQVKKTISKKDVVKMAEEKATKSKAKVAKVQETAKAVKKTKDAVKTLNKVKKLSAQN